jgi:hypothetical protein
MDKSMSSENLCIAFQPLLKAVPPLKATVTLRSQGE